MCDKSERYLGIQNTLNNNKHDTGTPCLLCCVLKPLRAVG